MNHYGNRVKESIHGVDELSADLAGRCVAIALIEGNLEKAKAAIDHAWNQRRKLPASRADKLAMSIAELFEDEPAVAQHLDSMGILTVRDLLNTKQKTLMRSSNFGRIRMRIVLERLRSIGFAFGEKQ